MTDEELLELYNKKVKPEGMTDKDYELNMNKANKLQQDKILQDNLTSQQSAIEQQQKNAEQSASIANEKLLKYLGQKQISSGLASGQTSSDFINANNSYVANRANIANNTATQQAELLNTYNTNKLQNETNAYNNEISILDKYRQRDIEDKQLANAEQADIKAEQNNAFNELATIINSQTFNTTSELEELYNSYKDNLSLSQQTIAKHMINYYKNNPEQQEIEKQANYDSSAVLTGKEYLTYNGQDYQIVKDNKIDISNSLNSEILYSAVEQVLGKNNPYDKSIENGTSISYKDAHISWLMNSGYTREESEKMLNYMGAEEGFNDFALTYFDGEWYTSQKR